MKPFGMIPFFIPHVGCPYVCTLSLIHISRCHNTNRDKLTVIRRTCGYLGENFWNEGRTKEIKDRVMHKIGRAHV